MRVSARLDAGNPHSRAALRSLSAIFDHDLPKRGKQLKTCICKLSTCILAPEKATRSCRTDAYTTNQTLVVKSMRLDAGRISSLARASGPVMDIECWANECTPTGEDKFEVSQLPDPEDFHLSISNEIV